jgi:nicotinamide riboside kinase
MTFDVVLTGPESSGKTSMARHLGAIFAAPWVAEASRRFAESYPAPLSAHTVEPIAHLAMAMDDEARASAPTLLIHDTDLLSTVVYARHYYGECPAWILAEARRRRGDLYLLCLPDLPWEADGVRDRPTQRDELLGQFREALQEIDADYTEIAGLGDARRTAAESALRLRLG